MKVLIIDDEELTRKGLINTIDWECLQISQIVEAEDGLKGLEIARGESPDIILTDIRMPRMNGIEMAEKIKSSLPDVSVIFMSGYSDREYLKAAIRLKAVSYVEKPLDPLSVEDAIREAIENNVQLKRSKQSEAYHLLARAGQLALAMTYPPEQRRPFTEADLIQAGGSFKFSLTFTTVILKSTRVISEIEPAALQQIHENFAAFLSHYHMQELHVIKHDQYLIYHLAGAAKPEERILIRIAEALKGYFNGTAPFFIAVGETVSHLEQVYKSYNSAVIRIQSSFFHDYNSILLPCHNQTVSAPVFSDPSAGYSEALLSRDSSRVSRLEDTIYASFKNNTSLMPNRVKDIYYKLFVTVQNAYRRLSLDSSPAFTSADIILEYVQNCHTLSELHDLLQEKSLAFLTATQVQPAESPTVLAIKEFIRKNYQRESLSVKEIGDHVHMSSSYICTLFKNETNLTLNQYITNFRIEQAKLLLADSQYKITDISARIGYTDGNYFGKCFKKQVGLAPSEYREKMFL